CGCAFAGIALGSQIAGLQNLLKKVCLEQALSQPAAVNLLGARGFHLLLNPSPTLALRHVHELCANSPAIDSPRLFSAFALNADIGIAPGKRAAKRVKVGVQVSPAAEGVKNLFALKGRVTR